MRDPRDREDRRDPKTAQDAPGAIFSRGVATSVSPFSKPRDSMPSMAPLKISADAKTMWTLPPLWTHRTRPQGFGNLAKSARFPQRPHRSSISLKKNEEQNHSDQLSTESDHPQRCCAVVKGGADEGLRTGVPLVTAERMLDPVRHADDGRFADVGAERRRCRQGDERILCEPRDLQVLRVRARNGNPHECGPSQASIHGAHYRSDVGRPFQGRQSGAESPPYSSPPVGAREFGAPAPAWQDPVPCRQPLLDNLVSTASCS